jgi:hypothetical protein
MTVSIDTKGFNKVKKDVAKMSASDKAKLGLKLKLVKFNDWTYENEMQARVLGAHSPTNKFGGAHYFPTLVGLGDGRDS